MTQLHLSSLRNLLPLGVALAAASAAACGGGEQPVDAAMGNDAPMSMNDTGGGGDPDAASTSSLGTCAAPRMVSLTLGEPQTITGTTSGGPAGPLDLGADCGDPMAAMRPPQEVLAIEVPGTGEVGIAFDLTGGTPENFDTVVQLRTACETIPTEADSCFDDPAFGEVRSAGSFIATGGSTIYLVVTGFPGGMGTVASGAYSMLIQAEANSAPTLTAATARRVDDDRLEIFATGMDAQSNVVGVGVQLLGAGGMPIPADAAMAEDLGPYFFAFDAEITMAAFADALATAPGSADLDGVGTATGLRLFTYDFYGARSATRDVTIDMVSEVGFGTACDATHLCRAPNVCEAGMCVASAGTLAVCAAATAVALEAPTGATPTVSMQSVMLGTGEGETTGTGCEYTADATEKVLNVTVPAGSFDLIATTNLAGNPVDLDTVVYVRSTCSNDTTELTCDDDYAGAPDGDYRSFAVVENVAAGTHAVFIDGYAPFEMATTVAVELRLRPVLATGAACDPMGEMNRCMGGACPASGAAVCP